MKHYLSSPIEVVPNSLTIGEISSVKCECGCNRWYDKETGKQVEVIEMTWDEFTIDNNNCQVKP